MDRGAIIERLATNEAIPFTREALEAMGDGELEYLANMHPEAEPEGEQKPEADLATITIEPASEPTVNAEVAKALNELGADGIAQVINSAQELAAEREEKRKGMVSMLVANEQVTIPEASLRTMDLEALTGVARMAGIANYSGAGAPVANREEKTGPPPPPRCILGEDS